MSEPMKYYVFSMSTHTKLREYFVTVSGNRAEYSLNDAEFEAQTQTRLYAAKNTTYGFEPIRK